MNEPTDEQRHALAMFSEGLGLAIEAGSGTGKTSTLQLLAESTKRRGQYVAFNRAIVEEAQRRMPHTVAASTMHSLAFRTKGAPFKRRLDSGRMASAQLARMLRIDPITVTYDGKPKVIQPATLGSLAMRAIVNFCQSADRTPGSDHVPYIPGIDEPDADGRRAWANNDEVRRKLAPALERAWADLIDPNGQLPFRHDHYLKAYELDAPQIPAEFILFDEAQDAAPVMESIVFQQKSAQLVVVGDANQAIYGWRGAVDSLTRFKEQGEAATSLTRSFRFGPPIADVANTILGRLDSELRLTGSDNVESTIAELADEEVDAILCRTNATAVTTLMRQQMGDRPVHLLGGGKDVLSFARAARDLKAGAPTTHPELACFTSWPEVQAYVEQDPSGDELRLLVKLVDEFGVDAIVKALDNMPGEYDGTLVVSTAHKAKGREWNRVRLAPDFPNPDEKKGDLAGEWKLLYVAATRARHTLDLERCEHLYEMVFGPRQISLGGLAI